MAFLTLSDLRLSLILSADPIFGKCNERHETGSEECGLKDPKMEKSSLNYEWPRQYFNFFESLKFSSFMFTKITCFACCLRSSPTDSGPTIFHSAAILLKTSAPVFNTWMRRWSWDKWAKILSSSWE